MVDPNPGAILREWQEAIVQLTRAAPTGPLDQELVGRMLAPLKGQLDAFQRVLDQQREAQEQLVGRVFEPIDQVVGALDDTATAMRGQAAALRQAGESLSRVAELLDVQATVIEGASTTVRVPTELVRAPIKRDGAGRGSKARSGANARSSKSRSAAKRRS